MTLYTNDDVRWAVSAIGRVALSSDENGPRPQDLAAAVLDAVAPAIAARALREAADHFDNFDEVTIGDVEIGSNLVPASPSDRLRGRADEIEAAS